MRAPVSRADFFSDQLISCRLIGYPQQGLCQAHERDTFLIGQPKFLKEGIQGAGLVTATTATVNQQSGLLGNRGLAGLIEVVIPEQLGDHLLFIDVGLTPNTMS